MTMPVRARSSTKLHLSPTNFPQIIEPTTELVRRPAKNLHKRNTCIDDTHREKNCVCVAVQCV